MENQRRPVCPQCGKPAQLPDAAFCPYCGATMQTVPKPAVPEGAKSVLQKAAETADPRKKHKLLSEAQNAYPDCLEIAEELLFLGRLHERSARNLDYSVIKCYLYQMYLTPDQFTQEQCDGMREELFEHPQLKRCQELVPNAALFTSRYLERLADEFVRLFLRGSSRYMPSFFGLRMEGRAAKQLAGPTAFMMTNIRKDAELLPERREMLYSAIYRGFVKQMSGESKWLDEALEQKGCPVPAQA